MRLLCVTSMTLVFTACLVVRASSTPAEPTDIGTQQDEVVVDRQARRRGGYYDEDEIFDEGFGDFGDDGFEEQIFEEEFEEEFEEGFGDEFGEEELEEFFEIQEEDEIF